MNHAEFVSSLDGDNVPDGVGELLGALWYEARGQWRRGDWDRAHQIVQALSGPDAAAVHAYLHRREGDLSNAAYWYRRAGVEARQGDLEAEWTDLVRAHLSG